MKVSAFHHSRESLLFPCDNMQYLLPGCGIELSHVASLLYDIDYVRYLSILALNAYESEAPTFMYESMCMLFPPGRVGIGVDRSEDAAGEYIFSTESVEGDVQVRGLFVLVNESLEDPKLGVCDLIYLENVDTKKLEEPGEKKENGYLINRSIALDMGCIEKRITLQTIAFYLFRSSLPVCVERRTLSTTDAMETLDREKDYPRDHMYDGRRKESGKSKWQ